MANERYAEVCMRIEDVKKRVLDGKLVVPKENWVWLGFGAIEETIELLDEACEAKGISDRIHERLMHDTYAWLVEVAKCVGAEYPDELQDDEGKNIPQEVFICPCQ